MQIEITLEKMNEERRERRLKMYQEGLERKIRSQISRNVKK